jgi:hypothetical protein
MLKSIPLSTLITAFVLAVARGQGTLNISQVPVTNGVTGALADSSIVAGLYYGASGTPETGLTLLSSAPLVNGYAIFGSHVFAPGWQVGDSVTVQVRAWSATYRRLVGAGRDLESCACSP